MGKSKNIPVREQKVRALEVGMYLDCLRNGKGKSGEEKKIIEVLMANIKTDFYSKCSREPEKDFKQRSDVVCVKSIKQM